MDGEKPQAAINPPQEQLHVCLAEGARERFARRS
jgi:hypothetical protein